MIRVSLLFIYRKYKIWFNYTFLGFIINSSIFLIGKTYSQLSQLQEFNWRVSSSFSIFFSKLGFFTIKIWKKYYFEKKIIKSKYNIFIFSNVPPIYFSRYADQLWLAFNLKIDWRFHKLINIYNF